MCECTCVSSTLDFSWLAQVCERGSGCSCSTRDLPVYTKKKSIPKRRTYTRTYTRRTYTAVVHVSYWYVLLFSILFFFVCVGRSLLTYSYFSCVTTWRKSAWRARNSPKVISILNLPCAMTVAMTFENIYGCNERLSCVTTWRKSAWCAK